MLQKTDQKSLIYLVIVVIAFLIAVSLIYYFSKKPILEPVKEIPQVKTKILTPEEIEEALSKKAEPSTEIQPFTEKQIKQGLQKKIPLNERPKPLTPEEIQEALNKKAE